MAHDAAMGETPVLRLFCELGKFVAAVFEIFELVVAGAAGAEENGVAGGGDVFGDLQGGGQVVAIVDGRGADVAGLAHGFGDGRSRLADAQDSLGALNQRCMERIER